MKALVYLRVSTDRQAQKGLSIPAQKERCLEYANKNGFEVNEDTDIYVDAGESARTANRPQFRVLWERCRSDREVKAVVFYDISRLARNRIDFALIKQDLEQKGISICSATEGTDKTPSGQMLEGVLSSVAEFFSLQSAEKLKAGMNQKVKDGWWPTRAPYGYKNVQEKVATGKVRAWLQVSWQEAKWVIKTFELFATGNYSLATLAEALGKEGFLLRRNKNSSGKVCISFLAKMLRDKFYTGVIDWGGLNNPSGRHEFFLDRGLFEKAQAILDARLGGGSRNRRLFSILKTISFCGECGSKMTAEEHTLKNGDLVRYLRCLKSQHSKRVNCNQGYGQENDYLNQFLEVLRLVQLPNSFTEQIRNRIKALFNDEQKIYEKARADILNKIEDIKRRKKNLVLQLIDNKASENDLELFQGVKVDLEADEKRLNEELAKSESNIANVLKTIEMALALAANCCYAYKKAPPELKALLVRTFFKKLIIKDKQIVQAVLNEPLDYLCRARIRHHAIFNLANVCGPSQNRTGASSLQMRCSATEL